ncbi:hypothetical protein HZS55_13150 [Halosimplex rubrum]|uniref:Uncharacterized protein n=1 Tax=Halosimplex rubrum TaxID=869889 RepID=A0A7D5TPK1_9EURY|nr:hypothetical protein [Halosimplex rubrum]QLH78194.1 hypothetical protein HZS55_13150 [Halosimplex rubrum]
MRSSRRGRYERHERLRGESGWERPLVVGAVYGTTAFAYTAAYVTFVSPYGLFLISAGMLVGSATVAAVLSGVLVQRLADAVDPASRVRNDAFSGMFVGWLTLVIAPPLAVFGMMAPMDLGSLDVSLITPLLIAAYLLGVVGYGLIGTLIALVATLGTPILVAGAVGVGLGHLRRRSGSASVAPPDSSGG